MHHRLTMFILLLVAGLSQAQDKPGTSFHGQSTADAGPCATSANFMTEQDVERLITDMLDRIDIQNRYLIVSCTKVENCQAMIYRGKPYILYNPEFLQEVKRLNFSSADIKVSTRNWEALAILAHELGHHVNNHLLNPHPDATTRDMELEADAFAGAMIFRMGGSRENAMAAFLGLPEKGTYTHPGRQQRLDAVAKGWDRVKSRSADPTPAPKPDPKPDPVKTDPVKSNPKPDPKPDPVKTDPVKTDPRPNPVKTDPVKSDPKPDQKPDPVKTDPVKPAPAPSNTARFAAVSIGGQVWMAQNLNVDRFRNGDPIPEARTDSDWKFANHQKQPAWCYYNNDSTQGATYGRLYNWYAVADPRGLAPEGWHVPSDAEWTLLTDGLGGRKEALMKLKSSTGWYRGGNGIDAVGFAGLPGGFRGMSGEFDNVGEDGYWWSASPGATARSGKYRSFTRNVYTIGQFDGDAGVGCAVRCVRD